MKHIIIILLLIGCIKENTPPSKPKVNTYTHWVIKGNFYIERYYPNGMRVPYTIKDSFIIDSNEKLHLLIWKEGKSERLIIEKNYNVYKDTICTRLYVEHW